MSHNKTNILIAYVYKREDNQHGEKFFIFFSSQTRRISCPSDGGQLIKSLLIANMSHLLAQTVDKLAD